MIWPMDDTLIGTDSPYQSEPEINCSEGVLNISQSSELEPHHLLVYYPIQVILWMVELYSYAKMQFIIQQTQPIGLI